VCSNAKVSLISGLSISKTQLGKTRLVSRVLSAVFCVQTLKMRQIMPLLVKLFYV
jgi:hypothetical protein